MIDRYLIRYFLAVVDEGSFSRAAAQCRVSQPTLSAGIAKLERVIGTRLFNRSNQRVELTDAGSRFQIHARRIEREFLLAFDVMRQPHVRPAIRIGILNSIPGARVAAAVAQSGAGQHANALEFLPGSERELAGYLGRGRIDVALTLVGRGGDRFLEREIHREGYALAVAAAHPLAAANGIRAEDVASDVMIVRRHCEALSETSRHFTERGIRPHLAFRSNNDERVLQLVAAGLGITVMPMIYAFPGVVRPKLLGFDLERTLGFAFAHDAEPMAADLPLILAALSSVLADP